jgi:hypothetical protein
MPGIYIAALITIAILLCLVSLIIIKRLAHWDRLFAILSMILAGAAFFGAYYLLRLPLNRVIHTLIQTDGTGYLWISSLYAPLTEEPAKWIVLIPLFLVGWIKSENKGAWAICLGLGFGIGEILFLAQSIASNPLSSGLPWYYSSGFIVERLMVCFVHSGLILIAIEAILSRKYWLILLAPVFHWLLNMPIILSIQFPFNDGGFLWSQLLWSWTTLSFIASLIYLGSRLLNTTQRKASVLGRAVCPECQTLYVRPWRGINRIGKRYERCPNCKHDHWTTLYVENKNE